MGRIGFEAVADVANLNLARGIPDGASRVLEQHFLLRRCHQAEQCSWLRVIICVFAMIPIELGCLIPVCLA